MTENTSLISRLQKYEGLNNLTVADLTFKWKNYDISLDDLNFYIKDNVFIALHEYKKNLIEITSYFPKEKYTIKNNNELRELHIIDHTSFETLLSFINFNFHEKKINNLMLSIKEIERKINNTIKNLEDNLELELKSIQRKLNNTIKFISIEVNKKEKDIEINFNDKLKLIYSEVNKKEKDIEINFNDKLKLIYSEVNKKEQEIENKLKLISLDINKKEQEIKKLEDKLDLEIKFNKEMKFMILIIFINFISYLIFF